MSIACRSRLAATVALAMLASGCAVRAGVEAGELGEDRLASYHKLRAES